MKMVAYAATATLLILGGVAYFSSRHESGSEVNTPSGIGEDGAIPMSRGRADASSEHDIRKRVASASVIDAGALLDAIASDNRLSQAAKDMLLRQLFHRLGGLDFAKTWELAKATNSEKQYLPYAVQGWASVSPEESLAWALTHHSYANARAAGVDNVYLARWATGAFGKNVDYVLSVLGTNDAILVKDDILSGIQDHARNRRNYSEVFDAISSLGDKQLTSTSVYSDRMLELASTWSSYRNQEVLQYLTTYRESETLRGVLYRTAGRELAKRDPVSAMKFVTSPDASGQRAGARSVVSTWMNKSGDPQGVVDWAMSNPELVPNIDDVLCLAANRLVHSEPAKSIAIASSVVDPTLKRQVFADLAKTNSDGATPEFIGQLLNALPTEWVHDDVLNKLASENPSAFNSAILRVADIKKREALSQWAGQAR